MNLTSVEFERTTYGFDLRMLYLLVLLKMIIFSSPKAGHLCDIGQVVLLDKLW